MHVLGKILENLLSFFIQRVKGMLPIFFFSENVDEIVNSHSFGSEPALLWAEYNLIESAHNLHWVALVICILVNLMFHR